VNLQDIGIDCCGSFLGLQMMRRLWLLFAQTVTVCLGILFIVTTLRPDWLPRTGSMALTAPMSSAPAPAVSPPLPLTLPASYAQAVAAAAPSVVRIYTRNHVENPRPGLGLSRELERLFGELPGVPPRRPSTSLGSGVIVRTDGSSAYILTNHHVIARADAIEVALTDGRQTRARIVGSDPDSDLAVLQIDLPDLRPIVAAVTSSLQVGDVVLAIGNPFGVGQTTTMGIVSALGRSRLGINLYENFIQTDAAINPGNSGGALIDVHGRMVGINTAIYSETGGSLGIGFAIPVQMALTVLEQILEYGTVTRGWLGIEPQDITPDLARAFGLQRADGVIIAGVLPNSPAARAGMQVGDIVLRLGDDAVSDSIGLLNQIAPLTPGNTVRLQLLRDGKPRVLEVVVGRRPGRG